jgi:hypothetical protein
MAATLMFLFAFGLMIGPALHYLAYRTILPWMIYRFLVSDLAGIAACLFFCAGYLTDRIVSISLSNEISGRDNKWTAQFFHSRGFWAVPALFVSIGLAFILSSVTDRLLTGGTDEHWSRYVVMTFWVSTAFILSVTRVIDYFLGLVAQRLHYLQFLLPADLVSQENALSSISGKSGKMKSVSSGT